MFAKLLIIFLSLRCVLCQDANCDFQQYVDPASRYAISSPNYPSNYPAGVVCRWIGICPAGYNCRLDCQFNLPVSTGCSQDRVLISRTGDPQLLNAERYCGTQTVNGILSAGNNISVGLVGTNGGGRFQCQLSAQRMNATADGCMCGERRQTRIVGGVETGVHEYPMMAGLIDNRRRQVFCGAVIISQQYVMTAAHCLDNLPQSVDIVVGHRNYTLGTRYAINSFIVHPNYNSTTNEYDIALIKTQNLIQFNNDVSAVCLPFKYQYTDFVGENVTDLGWGTLYFGGPATTVLRMVNVQVISNQQCRQTESNISGNKFCAYTRGKDACQLDSGGPALYTDRQTGRLFSAGIISEGEGCASTRPGQYTRVTAFLRFIVDSTRSSYCVVN